MEQLIGTAGDLEVEKIVVGGEACPRSLADRIARSGIPAWNFYGPTEATVWTAISPIVVKERVTIGRPIANTQLYILDEHLQPTPIGVAGELHIGGAGLARGYMQNADLTAQRFIPHPFSTEPGARLYKTGDLTRYLPDGRVEFIERIDNQVKVRGFRIELGDVETAIASHGSVKEVAVIVREDEPGDKRLVAYVVTALDRSFSARALREHARAKLPEYMVPSVLVELERLPLTSNGKVDRRSLPAPDAAHVLEKDQQQPRTPVEDLLASIWANVLKIEQVGIRDNFFDLGGHSLLATQVMARVREAFHVELPLLSLFKAPTVAGLAEQVETAIKGGVKSQPIRPFERNGHIPLSFAQQRLWFLDQLEPGSGFYNTPAAVRLTGQLDLGALERTLNEVVRRHEVLRTRFVTLDGEAVQVISPAVRLTMPVVDLSEMAVEEREAEARRLAAVEVRSPFDLSAGPLLRVKLLRLGEEEQIVLFNMHHVVSDGWSRGILVREVAALYEAYVEGRESPLEELAIQYADYAMWQREWLQGECWTSSCLIGGDSWEESCRCCNCPLTDHVRSCRAIGASGSSSH
jgi:acyl carrier protein